MTDLLAATALSGLVELAARATIVLLVSLAVQWLTRKGPATARHHLWTLTFALLLALPALGFLSPSWDVPLLPRANEPSAESRLEALAHGASAHVAPPGGGLAYWVADAPVARGARGRAETPPPPPPLARFALVIWGIGFGAALVSVGVGAFRFQELVRAGQLVENEAWLRQLDDLRSQLSIRAEVRLVLGTEFGTPMTGGLRSPVILLPASAPNWTEERRRLVLAHELVHVRRRDALRLLADRAALALFWFHPLSWVASHLAAATREEACDEAVLAVGARPSEYAGHILSLAKSSALGRPALSLPMARRSQLERRIRAILRPHRARPRALVSAAALAAVAVAGVSASVANPTRPGSAPDAPDAPSGGAAVAPVRVDCTAASDADRLSRRVFVQGDGLFVCAIEADAVPSDSGKLRVIGSAEWIALETEIRKQIARNDAEGSGRTHRAAISRPARERQERAAWHVVEAEAGARRGPGAR